MPNLILLRHGQSQWNAENRFTGWHDVDLSQKGIKEAEAAGKQIGEAGFRPEKLHTSFLLRAIKTANSVLEELNLSYIPVERTWRLNERHYGALQGLNKAETAEKYGAEQVKIWRRSFDIPPAPVEYTNIEHPINDPRYKNLDKNTLPSTECLKDVVNRLTPYWQDSILRDLYLYETVLVVAHGNSLRALIKILENLSDHDIVEFDLPTGVPRVYLFDSNHNLLDFKYLGDQEDIEKRAAEVAAQAAKK
jgi:2,3-bisphosphoglycerate-dependent phosphoglycerate mutase